MIYYLSENNSEGKNAGNKARNDVEKILATGGAKKITGPFLGKRLPHGNRLIFFLKLQRYWNILKKKLPHNSWIFIQYPLMAQFSNSPDKVDYSYFFKRISRRYHTIVLIHDLTDVRGISNRNSIDDLKLADYIISHNSSMSEYLYEHGIKRNKVKNLEIFDYLISKENISNHFNDKSLICFAGNLSKSSFIYSIPNSICKLGINLYGVGYNSKKSKNKVGLSYEGSYSSEEISSIISGKFGLIWDGDSYKTCTGKIGNYLRYNNPHKLSMYIVANMPVVIWKDAAEAKFVQENGIGILISSLEELKNLKNMSEQDYNKLVKNIKQIKKKIESGNYLYSILKDINYEWRKE